MHAKCSSKTIIIKLGRVHSSPHTQTVEALHRVAVPQQEAALLSEPLQQPLCGLAPDSPEVEGPNLRTLRLHASLRATEGSMCWASVWKLPQSAEKKKLVFTLLQHKCSSNHAHWLTLQVACVWFVFVFFFSLSLPSFHLLLIQIQKHSNNRTLVTFGHLVTYIRWGWKSCFSGTNCCKLLTLFFRPTKSCKSTTSPWWRVVAVNQRQQKYIYRLCKPAYLHSSLLVHLCEAN